MSEWLKHTGETNPVPNTVVEVYLNSGKVLVENSEDLIWTQPSANGDGSVVFYHIVNTDNTNNTTPNDSIPKDTLKLVLANALKNRKDIGSLYADLIELL